MYNAVKFYAVVQSTLSASRITQPQLIFSINWKICKKHELEIGGKHRTSGLANKNTQPPQHFASKSHLTMTQLHYPVQGGMLIIMTTTFEQRSSAVTKDVFTYACTVSLSSRASLSNLLSSCSFSWASITLSAKSRRRNLRRGFGKDGFTTWEPKKWEDRHWNTILFHDIKKICPIACVLPLCPAPLAPLEWCKLC